MYTCSYCNLYLGMKLYALKLLQPMQNIKQAVHLVVQVTMTILTTASHYLHQYCTKCRVQFSIFTLITKTQYETSSSCLQSQFSLPKHGLAHTAVNWNNNTVRQKQGNLQVQKTEHLQQLAWTRAYAAIGQDCLLLLFVHKSHSFLLRLSNECNFHYGCREKCENMIQVHPTSQRPEGKQTKPSFKKYFSSFLRPESGLNS